MIISDRLWRRCCAGDPNLVGRQLDVAGERVTVVGIMPRTLENVLAPEVDLWIPFRFPSVLPAEGSGWGHNLRLVGRLRAGVSIDEAARDLGTVTSRPLPEFARPAWASMGRGLTIAALRDDLTRAVRPALLAVSGAPSITLRAD